VTGVRTTHRVVGRSEHRSEAEARSSNVIGRRTTHRVVGR